MALAGCSAQRWDSRTALVVVRDPTLFHPTLQAARWWSAATLGEVKLELAANCEITRWCTTIDRGSMASPLVGYCSGGWGAHSNIMVDEGVRDERSEIEILAHELGHSFGLGHANADEFDVMYYQPVRHKFVCTGTVTQENYQALYGPNAKLFTLCGPDIVADLPDMLAGLKEQASP